MRPVSVRRQIAPKRARRFHFSLYESGALAPTGRPRLFKGLHALRWPKLVEVLEATLAHFTH